MIRLGLVLSWFDPFSRRLSWRRLRDAPESLLEDDTIKIANIPFTQGAFIEGKSSHEFVVRISRRTVLRVDEKLTTIQSDQDFILKKTFRSR